MRVFLSKEFVLLMKVLAFLTGKKGAHAELIGIGPEINQILLLFPLKRFLLFGSLSRLIQADVVEIHLA